MRIALVSTCAVAVPPRAYGGTELVIAELAKMLTRLGHEVTVFATGDSRPEANLLSLFPAPIWPPSEAAELEHVRFAAGYIGAHVGAFDVVHAHQAQSLALLADQGPPLVVTLHHDRVSELIKIYQSCPDATYVAISQRQAQLSSELSMLVVHHGLDLADYPAGDGLGGYCAFLGRLAPTKAPHLAIDAAVLARTPLKIGGVAHSCEEGYFAREVQPRIARAREQGASIEHLGEVSHAPKVELLRHARALLFPIQWEEPFGLVMIEAMLVGTPVIGFPAGAAPEVIEEGVTGFVVRTVEEMADRLGRLDSFDRARCRARARERWSSLRMAREYEHVYREVISEGRRRTTISGIHTKPYATREEPSESFGRGK
jgi:glycosyltransferase involved in cell wall biosynthesis